jgi:hypothetical protein
MFARSSYSTPSLPQSGKGSLCAVLISAFATLAVATPMALAQDVTEQSVGPLAAPAVTFRMVRSASAVAGKCLAGANATVTIEKLRQAERMTIVARNLPPNTDFVVFVIQVANAPFGLSWYQGDLLSNDEGEARVQFVGRFNIESFIVAPGVAPAPQVHKELPFPDAKENPATAAVHTYHLGVWFDSVDGAVAAGCPATETPFNGDHTAGIQALSARQITGPFGPLHRVPE